MMKNKVTPHRINSISEQHRILGLPKPRHPMISVYNAAEMNDEGLKALDNFTLSFYCINIKKNFTGKLKYGQNFYDFDEGMLTFISPNQILSKVESGSTKVEGIGLMFHPDFLKGHPLATSIRQYGFFSYGLSEALHLSEEEEKIIDDIMKGIAREYENSIDQYSQQVMLSQIELLLQYSNRFYNRQFITRKPANDDILIRLEDILSKHFSKPASEIPTVSQISDELHLSPDYLSDMLKSITGMTTQQHIHQHLMEKAKELLGATSMSVSDIAYQLGFGSPQSFSKLFKKKMSQTPVEYKQGMMERYESGSHE